MTLNRFIRLFIKVEAHSGKAYMVTTRLRRLSVFLAVTLPLYIWFLRNLFAKVGHVAKKCSFSNSISEVNRGPHRS